MILLIAALLETVSPNTPVFQRLPVDAELNRCLGVDDKTNPGDPVPHIVACYDAAQARADAALVAGYAKLRSTYAAKSIVLAEIDAGEKAFRAYRESWCKVDEAAEDEPRMTVATAKMCWLELTRYQLYRIDSVG
jgi:hypothetical protein